MVDKSPCLPSMIQLRLSEYVNKGSLYDILKDEITMPSISLQMKLCFIKGLGSLNKYIRNRPEHIVLGNSPLILDKRYYKWNDLHW